MKPGFVKSSPYFFSLINRAMYGLIAVLLLMPFFISAPLQEQANPAITPNPAKSAWFLLWIQELVSWSGFMIYPVLFVSIIFLLLPWLPLGSRAHQARWFSSEQRSVATMTVILSIVILLLTIVAFCFRGADWSFVF